MDMDMGMGMDDTSSGDFCKGDGTVMLMGFQVSTAALLTHTYDLPICHSGKRPDSVANSFGGYTARGRARDVHVLARPGPEIVDPLLCFANFLVGLMRRSASTGVVVAETKSDGPGREAVGGAGIWEGCVVQGSRLWWLRFLPDWLQLISSCFFFVFLLFVFSRRAGLVAPAAQN